MKGLRCKRYHENVFQDGNNLKQQRKNKFKIRALNTIGVIGIVAGIFTSTSLLPQLIKILKEKKVEGLSMTMFLSLLIGIILWVVYGILRDDWPIIVTNSFSVVLNLFILVLKFKYRRAS